MRVRPCRPGGLHWLNALVLSTTLSACDRGGKQESPTGPAKSSTEVAHEEPGEFSGVPGAEGFDCSEPIGALPILKASQVVTGLDEPMWLSFAPGGDPKRLFVLERAGLIRIIEDNVLLAAPFLEIKSKVALGSERGLLGMAFHPKFTENGLLYLHYNDSSEGPGDTIIEEYKMSRDTTPASATSVRRVLHVEQPYSNHNGGAVNFGKDGFLYIGLGDGGDANDPHGNGQNLDSLLGKMLRIDPTQQGSKPYGIPKGNLHESVASAKPEIWDYGLRNPFRSTFDGCTGNLYIGDVGQNSWEEIDIENSGQGNKNYGWDRAEGEVCFEPKVGCDQTGLTKPVWVYDRLAGQSVTGGAVYRGRSMSGLRGAYLFADYASGGIWSTVYDPKSGEISQPVSHTSDLGNVTQLVAINNGPDGELYLVSLEGVVYKLEPAE